MRQQRRYSILRFAALFVAVLLFEWAPVLATPITYLVTVNTSAISGTSGFLDFDFAPGNDSQNALVSMSNFFSSGSLTGSPQVNGGISGILPGILTIDNSTQFNDYFQGFDYGATLSFLLALSGPALSSPNGTSTSGSTFGFGMFDSTGINPLLTTDPNGNAFTVDVNLDGTTTIATFPPNFQGGPPVVTVKSIPEPSTPMMLLVALAGMALLVHRARSRRRVVAF
jgi:hypothetical protein